MSIMDQFREDEIIEIVDKDGMTMIKTSIVSTHIPQNITATEAVSEISNEIN